MTEIITVIVPVYNTGDYLDSCIKSIVYQDYPNTEIIIVDDGSTDLETISLCDKLAATYENVKVYHKQNGGSASARNYGILHAKGKYIGFVDSDDVIDEKMYSSLHSLIKKDDVEVAICGLSTEENGKVELNDIDLLSGCYNHQELMHHFFLGHWHSACTCLYKKTLFNHSFFPEGEINEDYMLNYRIFSKLPKLSFTKEPYYHYLRREGSNTSSPKTLRFLDWIKHTKLVMEEMIQQPSLKSEAEYQYLYSNIILGNSALLTINSNSSEESEKLYEIVTSNLCSAKKMLHNNPHFSLRNKLMGLSMAYIPLLYRTSILLVLKLKKFL